ncbi:tRNA pseudouridine(13) synthase TruD [Candidatus Thorarchaeota archaeon]|nr:MAG: tRNA pseudouridine(13) synthase TruD [Candidatus Thorarchaeota archaeon]
MIEPLPIEKNLGMELYSTDCQGIGGKLKTRFEDFVVEEIIPDRTVLTFQDWKGTESTYLDISGERNRFITFSIQKMGISTMAVSRILASSLGLPRNLITYAGLKDKRAVTVQRMSAPSKVATKLGGLELSRIEIRDVAYTRHPVQIGDLWGNQFTIILRNIEIDTEKALEIAEIIRYQPLLNYFGVQRFGLSRPSTHLAGKSLILRDFESAVRTILCTPGDYESDELRAARQTLADDLTPNESIIESFPKDLSYERTIMNELMKKPYDFERAILRIEPRVLTLMVHAYQSYLFNRLLSERARTGMSIFEPEPGDFLIALDIAHSGRDSWLFVTDTSLDERREQAKNLEWGLALPVPGYATRVPPTRQSEMLKQILNQENIKLVDFRNSKIRALDSPGGLHLSSILVSDMTTAVVENNVKVRFRLRKGSYATIVMREFMKNNPLNRI